MKTVVTIDIGLKITSYDIIVLKSKRTNFFTS